MSCSEILLSVANYNQAPEIKNFLQELVKYWPKEHLIVVDDGSTDDSWLVPQQMGIQVLRHPSNRGVGAAIRTAIHFAKAKEYKSILLMSSNGKMAPAEISKIVSPILNNSADYTTGSRFMTGGDFPGMSLFRRWSIPLFSLVSSLLLGRYFTDITCGFRCYHLDFLFNGECDINQNWLDRYEMEYYIHFWACKKGLRISEVPVTIKYSHLEKRRHSKIRPFIDWWSMIKPLIYLRFEVKK